VKTNGNALYVVASAALTTLLNLISFFESLDVAVNITPVI
jgi:hypothetical protein